MDQVGRLQIHPEDGEQYLQKWRASPATREPFEIDALQIRRV